MSFLVGRDRKTPIIQKNGLSKLSDTAVRFPYCGRLRWDSLSAFGTSLRPTLLAIGTLVPTKGLRLWSGKINISILFAAEVNTNNTILLISVTEPQKLTSC